MASTPPPRTTIPVPQAPQHGAGFDSYGRSSSARRSERLAGRSSSPGRCSSDESSSPQPLAGSLRQDRSREDPTACSPQASPQTKSDEVTCPTTDADRCHNSPSQIPAEQHNSSTSIPPTTSASASTSTLASHHQSQNTMDSQNQQTNITAGMLPTPIKTPRKKAVSTAGLEPRSLFPPRSRTLRSEESSLKKNKGKDLSHFSLESFNSDPDPHKHPKIEVFTDSRDRIPQVNQSMDNPFLSKVTGSEMATDGAGSSSKKRRKVDSAGSKRAPEVDEAVRRDDGLLYVFRGRKVFRKFNPDSDGGSDSADQGLLSTQHDADDVSPSRLRPLTRSSVKPRVLFPNAAKPDSDNPTDDGDTAFNGRYRDIQGDTGEVDQQTEATDVGSATNLPDKEPITPPSKAIDVETPSSPMSGGRSLRSSVRKQETPHQVAPSDPDGLAPKRFSPFDRWRRTKGQSTPTKAKRTNASVTEGSDERGAKKLRGE